MFTKILGTYERNRCQFLHYLCPDFNQAQKTKRGIKRSLEPGISRFGCQQTKGLILSDFSSKLRLLLLPPPGRRQTWASYLKPVSMFTCDLGKGPTGARLKFLCPRNELLAFLPFVSTHCLNEKMEQTTHGILIIWLLIVKPLPVLILSITFPTLKILQLKIFGIKGCWCILVHLFYYQKNRQIVRICCL